MTNNRIAHDSWERNHHFEIVDDLQEYISKMQAMLRVALNCNFDNIKERDIRNYFWELESLVNAAETLAEDLI
jgi:hypothetical protein